MTQILKPTDAMIRKIALAFGGPYLPVPADSKFTLEQLREKRWQMLSRQEQQVMLNGAKSAIEAMESARDPDELREALEALPRLIELQRTAAPDCEREEGWNAALDKAAAMVSTALSRNVGDVG